MGLMLAFPVFLVGFLGFCSGYFPRLSCRLLLFMVVGFLLLFSLQLLGSTTASTLFLAVLSPPMDHAQGRAFHHHLARAIMHLNHLAGLLPFFEPSIEWEDSMPSSHFRLDRPTSRGLHTFVPLPPSSLSPTMVSHGGIPSHMVVNPEPNLRPTTTHSPSYMDGDHTSTTPVECRNPVLMTDPGPDPTPGTPSITEPGRGKLGPQSQSRFGPNNGFPQLLTHNRRRDKKWRQFQKLEFRWLREVSTLAHSPAHQRSLLEASTQMTLIVTQHQELLPLMIDTDLNYGHRGDTTSNITSTIPPGTSTLTLTPNPKAPPSPTFRILQPNPADPPRDPPFRPWTNADDQELISMKQDTKSRPSWKTIGARLHRDPQVCKLRWGILKQTPGVIDQHGRVNPPLEPEAED